MWAPTPAGWGVVGGETATALSVPREAWEGGSLCPAHREQTHRTPEGQALALRGWRPGNAIRGGGHKRGPLAQNWSFESWPSCHVTWRRVPERVMSGERCTGVGGLKGSHPDVLKRQYHPGYGMRGADRLPCHLSSTQGHLKEEVLSWDGGGLDFCLFLGRGIGLALPTSRSLAGVLAEVSGGGGGRGSQRTFPVLAGCAGVINVLGHSVTPERVPQGSLAAVV